MPERLTKPVSLGNLRRAVMLMRRVCGLIEEVVSITNLGKGGDPNFMLRRRVTCTQ